MSGYFTGSFSYYCNYFYNWLYTGGGTIRPPNLPPLRVAADPAQGGGNPAQAIPIPPPLPPPMNGLNIINMNAPAPSGAVTPDMLRSDEVLALRLRAHVGAREGERGHILARHHPSLSDEQLKARLLTGLDPEGEPAPTSGVSSRFVSEKIFHESLRAVHKLVADGLKGTQKYLHPNLARCAAADATHVNLQAQNAPEPQIRQAKREQTEAYNDLRLAVGVVANLEGHLPVDWDQDRRCVKLFLKYVISLYHNETQGVGFYGTGPKLKTVVNGKPPKGQGQQRTMTIYQRAHPFNGPANSTLTVMVTPDAPLNTLGRPGNIENWGLVTHYPQHDEDAKTKIVGQGRDNA